MTGSSEMSNSSGVDEHYAGNIIRSGHKLFFTPLNLKLASNDIILPSWETRLFTLTFKPILVKG